MSADQNLANLGLTLPPAPKPLGVYKPFLIVGNIAYVSGHGTVQEDGSLIIGRVGEALDVEAGKLAAQQVGLVVKVLGMVNATLDFERHPYVINGCSELFAQVWGTEKGVGVRSAVGMATLPDNIPVEVEAHFLLK